MEQTQLCRFSTLLHDRNYFIKENTETLALIFDKYTWSGKQKCWKDKMNWIYSEVEYGTDISKYLDKLFQNCHPICALGLNVGLTYSK